MYLEETRLDQSGQNLQAEFWEVPIQTQTARSPGGGEN